MNIYEVNTNLIYMTNELKVTVVCYRCVIESKYSLVHIFYEIIFSETRISHTICWILKLANLKALAPSGLHHDDKQVQFRITLKDYLGDRIKNQVLVFWWQHKLFKWGCFAYYACLWNWAWIMYTCFNYQFVSAFMLLRKQI